MVTCPDPVGNRNRRSPGHSPPWRTTKHGGGRSTPAASDSRSSPGVGLVVAVPGPTACSDGCSAWGGVLGPDPAGASLQSTSPLPRQVPMSYGVRAPPVTVTVRAQLPPSFTPQCGMSRPPCGSVSASCNLPSGPDGWPRSGVVTWAVSQPFPAVTPLVGPHSRDEAADLTATTGQAGTCWMSAKRLDSEDSSSEPRHQTIGRRFPECSGWRQPRARDAGQRGLGQPARRDGPDRGGSLPEAACAG